MLALISVIAIWKDLYCIPNYLIIFEAFTTQLGIYIATYIASYFEVLFKSAAFIEQYT